MSEEHVEDTGNIEALKPQLRKVDLNLLTIFDAVMQEQNITRAAHSLGMSQPAVSNALARLKVMFNDELFVRYGRGIQPTARAHQLFGSVRQALQLVQNELPGSGFEPVTSERIFNLCVCSPIDNFLTSIIYNSVEKIAPHIHLVFKSSVNQNTEHQLRYQELEFVIGYDEFHRPEFSCVPLFKDEMVLVASKTHPRIMGPLRESDIYNEQHAVVSLERYASFSQPWYDTPDKQASVAYQGMALTSVLNVVSQTHLIAIAPRWLAEEFAEKLHLQVLPLPLKLNSRTCYLSWHEAAGRDKGHQWMEELLVSVCSR
ncbi:transcriptional regulator LeuO [Yokenella regensburgei]|uniref:transcriptional regulator LeuO n=1 Tax=Yokenella regensburgei TaxID=158877 RepID=UPI003F1853AD